MSNCINIGDSSSCLAEIIKVEIDYDMSDAAFQTVKDDLIQIDTMLDNTLTYYGSGEEESVRIAYISDIHLHHHLKYYDDNEELMIEDVVEKLHHSLEELNFRKFNKIYAVIFGGDISETPETTIKFLKRFRMEVEIPIFFILGNHDYIEFPNVYSCVNFYKDRLQEMQITLLHNEYVVYNHLEEQFIIFGGTGFAKYDEVWNANRVVCCKNFTREDEIKETTLFETAYKSALDIAKEQKKCFLCLSHYPVSACLNNAFEREAIYFSGHNHCNEYVRKEDKVLFADNQVGYENNNIMFKEATTGLIINPYSELKDGLYKTTVEDYLKFYRYLGEYVGDGILLYNRCKNGTLCIVKSKGYYGFFILSKKGISIVNGGTTKKLTTSVDFSWIRENFDIVVSKYLQMLLPLRRAQEEISRELKDLGLDGKIHGLIVDIDFYHHVALNPMDGNTNFYYSSEYGLKKDLNSFDEVIKSLESHSFGIEKRNYELIRKKYEEKAKTRGYLLGYDCRNSLLETESYEEENVSQQVEQIVSRKEGMYGVSRKINPLQRLFTGRVLRDFDLRLTETTQQIAHRKKLYKGRVFKYEGVRYQIVEDKGTDIVIAEELQKGSRSKGNNIRLSGKKKKFAIMELKAKIKKNDGETYWID